MASSLFLRRYQTRLTDYTTAVSLVKLKPTNDDQTFRIYIIILRHTYEVFKQYDRANHIRLCRK